MAHHPRTAMPDKLCAGCAQTFKPNRAQRFCSASCALWANVERRGPDECWLWRGAMNHGYGDFRWAGRRFRASRVALESVAGPLGDRHALHRCDAPACCNPAHLFAGDHNANMRDMFAKGRHPAVRGAWAPGRRLTDAQISDIRQALAAKEGQHRIAARLGVPRHVIADISAGRRWQQKDSR